MAVAIAGRARRLLAPVARPLRRASVGARTRGWSPHSRLFVPFDAAGWVLEYEARHLEHTARSLGIRLGPGEWARSVRDQSVFHTSQFSLLRTTSRREGTASASRTSTAGPGRPACRSSTPASRPCARRHDDIDRDPGHERGDGGARARAGVAREKVFRIPIGIDLEALRAADPRCREGARRALGLPADAFVLGSFQKDGVGWGDGLEPKLIKGPDVLLAARRAAREPVPELFVLLTGPARGYVRGARAARRPVPARVLHGVDAVAQAYYALDVCLVTSRDEGGPKAVLEAMATGIPLVTTRVGQAADLVRDGENGYLVEVGDADGGRCRHAAGRATIRRPSG